MIPLHKLGKGARPLGQMLLHRPGSGLHSLVGKSPGSVSAHACPLGQLAFVHVQHAQMYPVPPTGPFLPL